MRGSRLPLLAQCRNLPVKSGAVAQRFARKEPFSCRPFRLTIGLLNATRSTPLLSSR